MITTADTNIPETKTLDDLPEWLVEKYGDSNLLQMFLMGDRPLDRQISYGFALGMQLAADVIRDNYEKLDLPLGFRTLEERFSELWILFSPAHHPLESQQED